MLILSFGLLGLRCAFTVSRTLVVLLFLPFHNNIHTIPRFKVYLSLVACENCRFQVPDRSICSGGDGLKCSAVMAGTIYITCGRDGAIRTDFDFHS